MPIKLIRNEARIYEVLKANSKIVEGKRTCSLSSAEIASELGAHVRSVRKALSDLERLGLIARIMNVGRRSTKVLL